MSKFSAKSFHMKRFSQEWLDLVYCYGKVEGNLLSGKVTYDRAYVKNKVSIDERQWCWCMRNDNVKKRWSAGMINMMVMVRKNRVTITPSKKIMSIYDAIHFNITSMIWYQNNIFHYFLLPFSSNIFSLKAVATNFIVPFVHVLVVLATDVDNCIVSTWVIHTNTAIHHVVWFRCSCYRYCC